MRYTLPFYSLHSTARSVLKYGVICRSGRIPRHPTAFQPCLLPTAAASSAERQCRRRYLEPPWCEADKTRIDSWTESFAVCCIELLIFVFINISFLNKLTEPVVWRLRMKKETCLQMRTILASVHVRSKVSDS